MGNLMGNSESKDLLAAIKNNSTNTPKQYLKMTSNQLDAIGLTDSKGYYIGFNEPLSELFGFEDKEVATLTLQNLLSLSHESEYENIDKAFEELKEKISTALSRGEINYKWKYKTIQNKKLDIFVWIHPVRLKDGMYFQVILRPSVDFDKKYSKIELLLSKPDLSPREISMFCLDEAIKASESTKGFVCIVNKTQDKFTSLGWSTNALKQCKMLNKPLVFNLEETGLWGEAIRQRKPIIENDYLKPNPLKRGIPVGHVPITRCAIVPIFESDQKRIVVVVGLADKESDYTQKDIDSVVKIMSEFWQIVKNKLNL
ncbi:hypothetical protein M0811_12865 [Anaeramoeba ignava]|uniref:PAS domain-containing protein n=1 Tax=Anaeramoeba ignava TaxID=1746090 RepID=A0A9Q0R5Q9_ANAIG|nr:hypothetical protein M0811_12865 [Anaeramoeba ignava]